LKRGLVLLALLAAAAPGPASARGREVEVVVTLKAPGLAAAAQAERALASVTYSRRRLALAAPSSVSYQQRILREQALVVREIVRAIPGARVRWRFTVTFNGLAVVVPAGDIGRLTRVAGVARVWRSGRYHTKLDRSVPLIGAPALWGTPPTTAGQGMKIAVIDEGVDQTHPFFNPAGFTLPAGFPKGNRAFTTAKVIAARAFAPPTPPWRNARLPFDPVYSEHGTHVAGIAAGNRGTRATGFPGTPALSGVAPGAYIGNYKALTIPTPDFGLDGNAAEIAAAIEAAVRDGMDVLNLSIGEPEVPLARDIVVRALNGAADAGVVPVVAAGNDFGEFGRGSISSPGSAPKAITVAASTTNRETTPDVIASFSSGGPTPISSQLKPDVTAPGEGIVSSVPAREGSWSAFSGTSMATPHVAGAAALLRQRHPTWTVGQIKSALEQTGAAVRRAAGGAEVSPTREGGGRIDLVKADAPLFFASPSGVSFGLLGAPATKDVTIALTDAGGGAGAWSIRVLPSGSSVSAPATVTVPGSLALRATIGASAAEGEASGFVVLTRGTDVRRIPWWVGVSRPSLAAPVRTLTRTGTYRGNTARGRVRVAEYRYPEPPVAALSGPEQVFGLRITRPVANFGVRIVSQGRRVAVQPRIVYGRDENRLTGYTALPFDLNPYRGRRYGTFVPVSGAILPERGTYSLVFDTRNRAAAGPFTFRLWIGDTTPPRIRLLRYARGVVFVSITDPGAGVDPSTIAARVDGRAVPGTFRGGVLRVRTGTLRRGSHALAVEAADFQETKNMENVVRILPNTRVQRLTFRVR
jgi:subtilisin family serine protease